MSRILLASCGALALALCVVAPVVSRAQAAPTTSNPSPSAAPTALPTMSPDQVQQLALNVLLQLQNARVDRSLFSTAMNAQFTDAVLQRLAPQLIPLGQPRMTLLSQQDVGHGMTAYTYLLYAGQPKFDEILVLDSQNKIAGVNFTQDTTH